MIEGNDNRFIEPKIQLVENTIISDRCVWCGEKVKMSDSHIIPEFLGGWFKPKISCEPCNTYLGAKVEALAKHNAFITAAMNKLGLDDKKEAFRHLKKYDVETGAEMNFKDGVVVPKTQWLDEKTLRATPEKSKEIRIAEFKKGNPNFPIKPLEEFFDDPKRKKFKYVGKVYTKKDYPEKLSTIKIKGTRDPDPRFIFKIVYEFLCLIGFLSEPDLRSVLRKYIQIDPENSKNRVIINKNVYRYIFGNTGNSFRQCKKLEDIPFNEHHYFVLRLSDEQTLYVELTLFGQLRNFFIIGSWKPFYDKFAHLLDLVHELPITGPGIAPYMYPNLKMKNHIFWVDAMIKCRLCEQEELRKKKS